MDFSFHKQIQIGDYQISENDPCFIIAEAGVNHNGDAQLAKELIDQAVNVGADAIKFQTFKTEKIVTRIADQADYQIRNTQKKHSQYEMLKGLELEFKTFEMLKDYADKKGIVFLSTPFDNISLDFLVGIGISALKVSSGDLTNHPFLSDIGEKNMPVIVSTGMATMAEVEDSLQVFKNSDKGNIVVLHCTTNYPCPYNEVNLAVIKTMRNKLDCLIGYSDHTLGILVPSLAVSQGACIIEKHFTLNKKMSGPDHRASLNVQEFGEMVKQIKLVETIMGSDLKAPLKSEIEIAKVARKSIITAKNLTKGHCLVVDDLVIKRPGTGIPPSKMNSIIGKRIIRNIKADSILTWSDVE